MCLLYHCAATVWGDSLAIETCHKCKSDSSQLHRICISVLYSVALYKCFHEQKMLKSSAQLSNVTCKLMMQVRTKCEKFLGRYTLYGGPPSYEILVVFELTACHIWGPSIHSQISCMTLKYNWSNEKLCETLKYYLLCSFKYSITDGCAVFWNLL
jgi:hypothetical protein